MLKQHLRRLSLPILVLVVALGFYAAGCVSNPTLRFQAEQAMAAGRNTEAEGYLSRALDNNPADWQARQMLGQVRMRQERWIDAQLQFEKALGLDPEEQAIPALLDQLAESLYQQGETQALYTMLESAAREYDRTDSYLRMGRYLELLGDIDGAAVAYRKAARLSDEDDPRPYVALANLYESAGDIESAVRALRQAHGVAPTDPVIAERLRRHGVVPGPAAELPPEGLSRP